MVMMENFRHRNTFDAIEPWLTLFVGQVIGIDIFARDSLKAWIGAFEKYGDKLDEWDKPLSNYRFVQGSVDDIGEQRALEALDPILFVMIAY